MIEYTLQRKAIKNVYIRVRDGQVIVTAPHSIGRDDIDVFVQQKRGWIDKQLNRKPIDLTPDAAWVKAHMDVYFEKWESVLGVHARERRVRAMKTRWGSCNIKDKRIWLSSYLGAYPEECLEYVIVHELCHLRERGHNARFYRLVESCLPDWEERRRQLKDGLDSVRLG